MTRLVLWDGDRWQVIEPKSGGVLLRRADGAIRWVSQVEVDRLERPGLQGLVRDGEWLVRK